MTAIKKTLISAENLREWMNNRLHENEEFKEFTFNTPSKSGTVKLNDSNWGFSENGVLHRSYRYSTELDEELRFAVDNAAMKIWAKTSCLYDIE